MKMLIAIIQPAQLDVVREALSKVGVRGMTVSEVKGVGRQKGHTEVYRGAEYVVDFEPNIRIEMALTEAQTQSAIEAVMAVGRAGNIGSGKIFVMPLEHVARIRSGEVDDDAI